MLRSCRTCFQASPFAYGVIERTQLGPSSLKCRIGSGIRGLAQKKAILSHKDAKLHVKPSQVTPFVPHKAAPYESLNHKLAKSKSLTVLYQAASQRQYIIGCYTVGVFLVSIAAYNFQTQYLFPAADLPRYVPIFIGVGSFMMACGGFWMFFRTQNIVRTISSIPSRSPAGPQHLLLQIERTSTVPFREPIVVEVPPRDVTLSSPICNNNAEQKIEGLIKEMTDREEQLKASIKTNLLTLPFRQANYWTWRAFVGVRRAFTNEGFNYLHVKGHNRVWKLDSDPAWALDNGKALDRLVKIKIA